MVLLLSTELTDEEKELLKHNPNVTVAFCNERFQRVMEKLDYIKESVDDIKNGKQEKKRSRRDFIYGTVKNIIGGGAVAFITFLIYLFLT